MGTTAEQWQAPPTVHIQINGDRVSVEIDANVRTAFLRIAHIDVLPVQASAIADMQYGIHNGGGG